jgi:REP element-mobilizing transposase RayT
MRTARFKVDAGVDEAVYHVMTRTVNGEHLLDDVAKEVLRKQLWQVADFCGVQVLTFALMSNHFHVLVRVPQRKEISDAELIRRWKVLYPKPNRNQELELALVQKRMQEGSDEVMAWRERQLNRMGDVSMFMKLLKQRFAVWYNRSHSRFGTLWAERFKSVLVEARGKALSTMAAYIDLNPVRAGLVDDPKDYRFCGYAEAVVGNRMAQHGLNRVTGGRKGDTLAAYRQMLFGKGSKPKSGAANLDYEQLQQVVTYAGRLP